MYKLLQWKIGFSFQSQIQLLIWYRSSLLDASISRVSQINFGNFCFFLILHCHLPRAFNSLFFFIHHYHLLWASLVHHCCVLILKLFQWQKQPQLMLPPQRLYLLHKIRIILVILCSCILEKIQEQFSLLNHWLEEKIILPRQDQWENLWLPRIS